MKTDTGTIDKRNPKALVTGASGFIGSHMVDALLEKKWNVTALVRKATDTKWLESRGVHLVHADYDDGASLERATAGMDVVFHLGAVLKAMDWETYYRGNALGTERLLEACLKSPHPLKRFVFCSSIAAAGASPKGSPKNEEAPCTPTSLYGKSKHAAEKIVDTYKGQLPIVTIRPPNVLGPGQKEMKAVIKLIQKRIIPLLGNGEKQTSICYVDDVVDAMILAAEHENALGQTYFVTDNREYSWREMLETIARKLGIKWALRLPYPMLYTIATLSEWISKMTGAAPLLKRSDVLSARNNYWLFNSDKIQEELGFVPKVPFEEGIEKITAPFK